MTEEETLKTEEAIHPVDAALLAEAASLRQQIKKLNTELGEIAGEHVKKMSKLETTKQSLNKMIQSVTTEISEEIRKKSSNQEKITTLKNKINIMKSKYDTTITVAYLKTKFNTLVFDYIYPWTFTVLGFMDRLYSQLAEKTIYYVEKIKSTEYYAAAMNFLSQMQVIIAEYWGKGISFINEKVGYDIMETIKQSSVVKNVQAGFESILTYASPSTIGQYVNTLRLALQMNEYISPYSEIVFYFFIGIWTLVPVSAIVSRFR